MIDSSLSFRKAVQLIDHVVRCSVQKPLFESVKLEKYGQRCRAIILKIVESLSDNEPIDAFFQNRHVAAAISSKYSHQDDFMQSDLASNFAHRPSRKDSKDRRLSNDKYDPV